MTKTEITTAVQRLENAVGVIDELCLNHKKNLFILSKKIFEYDNQFKTDELRNELERKGIMKGTVYKDFKKIGSKSLFHKEEFQKKLPNSYSALTQLAFLKDDDLRKYIQKGIIRSDTTIEDIKNLKSKSVGTNNTQIILSITCSINDLKKNKESLKKLKTKIIVDYPFLNVNGKI